MQLRRANRAAWGKTTSMLAAVAALLMVVPARSDAAVRAPAGVAPASELIEAAALEHGAERRLIARVATLRRCRRSHPREVARCQRQRRELQSAGRASARAERRLDSLAADDRAGHARHPAHRAAATRAPALASSGATLRWSSVGRAVAYVLRSSAPGASPRYSLVHGTSDTPPPIPGVTVTYTVRSVTTGASWSEALPISYPSAPQGDAEAAPALTVSGTAISWNAIAGVSFYIVAATPSGGATEYSLVTGTAYTPPARPGESVAYTVRTAVESSIWAPPVTIVYPPTAQAPGEASGGSGVGELGGPFLKGINEDPDGWGEGAAAHIGSEVDDLGADWVRVELSWKEVMPSPGVFDWTSFDNLVRVTEGLGLHILPVLGYAPSWTSPGNAAGYAEFVAAAVARYGPGTAADLPWFELWNEPYFSYAWSGQTPEPEAYARDVAAAVQASREVNPSAKFLLAAEYADGEQAGGTSRWETSWVPNMLAAVPNLGELVNGISVHPYGDDPSLPVAEAGGFRDAEGKWSFQRIDEIRAQLLAHGINLPFWITEVGWSTYEMSEAQQAHDYADLVTQVQARPWVRALFPYCLREFQEHPTDNESQTGLLLYGSEAPKQAFSVLQSFYERVE